MLIKRMNGASGGSRMSRMLGGVAASTMDRRTFFRRSGVVAGGLAAASALGSGTGDEGQGRHGWGRDQADQDGLHALLGRLHGDRRGPERRLDRPGARLRQPVQSRRALRQGRGGARACAWRAPAQVPDEARRRQMDQRSPGTRPSTRSATRCSRSARTPARIPSTGWAPPSTATSRPTSCASSRLLGHEQLRPPGAHLPFDHRRGRGEHLGLRRDDQLATTISTTARRCS